MRPLGKTVLAVGALSLAALSLVACDERPLVRRYPVRSDRIRRPLRLLHISDLHSSPYGRGMQTLITATKALAPDLVLLTGDICDNRVPNENAFAYCRFLGEHYPCYYVCGNHEVYTGLLPSLKEKLRSFGITVLEGSGERLPLDGQSIDLYGIDDPYAFPDHKGRLWEDQLREGDAFRDPSHVSILLTHRPEQVSYYAETGFDLVLAGHAHGGQVMLPHLLNGLYAPHQGLFPAYAGGRFAIGEKQTMIVSRGLSKYVRPRVFNRPELVLITLLPEECGS